MNPDATPNAPSTPPRPPAAPRTPAGGSSSVLKIAIPLVVLVGVVFGLTYISMQVQKPVETDGPGTTGADKTSEEPPLRFFTSQRGWDPPVLVGGYRDLPLLAPSALKPPDEGETGQAFPYSLQDRAFQGVYEASADVKRATQFWFENRNAQGVTLELKGVSCSACSGGRVAALPPEVTRNLLQAAAVGALPVGPLGGLKLAVVPAAAGVARLDWEEHTFENYREKPVKYHVPPAADSDKWSPQWGILELQYKAAGERKEPLAADFAAQVDGRADFAITRFSIMFTAAPACAVAPPAVDAGRFEPSSTAREFELLVYSPTRGPGSEFGDLDRPSYRVEGPAGSDDTPFVEVLDKKTARVPEAELPDLQNALRQRVRAAYRLTVAVRPKVGEKRMDIGRFERTVAVTAGGATQQVKVTATVRGAVWIDGDRAEISLGTFSGKRGLKQRAEDLITQSPGIELAVVKDESQPSNFVYDLRKQPDRGGQGHYKLFITVPPGQFGTVKGEVVLQVKGPNPQKMRIPVTGSGTFGP